MRHINREQIDKPGSYAKCFHVVKNVLTVHNHFPLLCIRGNGYGRCSGHTISINKSYVLHYKKTVEFPRNCRKKYRANCTVYDPIMWKYKQKLGRNMKDAMSNIFGYVNYN